MLGIVNNIADVLVLVLLFGFTIFIHELGHFLSALWCGMVVDTFSIGFGPAIWKKKIRGVTYKIGWIPFGGYVALPQLDPSSMEVIQGKKGDAAGTPAGAPAEAERTLFPPVAPWKKIVVSVAGALGNLILAVGLAYVIYLHPGAVTGESGKLAVEVAANSEAYAQGLRTGDALLAVNGKPVSSWYDFAVESLLGRDKQSNIVLTVASPAGEERALTVRVKEEKDGRVEVPGVDRYVNPCQIGAVDDRSVAAKAGLRPRDVVVAVGGVPVREWADVVRAFGDRKQTMVAMTVRRGDETVELKVEVPQDVAGRRQMIGIIKGEGPCDVAAVLPGRSADLAGVRKGDTVVSLAGKAVTEWDQLVAIVQANGGQELPLVVKREGQSLTLTVVPMPGVEDLLGISQGDLVLPWMRYKRPLAQIREDAAMIGRILKALVTPSESKQAAKGLGGPVAILVTLWAAIKLSLLNAVGFLRFLNVNLAILNMLPIPVLDGGHVLFALGEMLTRRRAHPRVVNTLINVFAALLIGVMLIVTYRDIYRLFPKVFSLFGKKDRSAGVQVETPATPEPLPPPAPEPP